MNITLYVSNAAMPLAPKIAFFRNLGNFIQKFKFGLQYVSPGGFLVYFSDFDNKFAPKQNRASE
jgi:hypothetical protein